jgi:methyltransferase (TIGR00027 family)
VGRMFGSGPAPSRTSQAVALTRSELIRPSAPAGDDDAQRLLCAGMPSTPVSWLRSHVAARTRFFDGQIQNALSAGIGQVVILGAGYDDRALRFRSPGVRFFEIDHPVTQADKIRRVRGLPTSAEGVVFAPADFCCDPVDKVLATCGHDAGSPSLFVCEGLLVYFDRRTITGLLAGLCARAAAGSTLAASLATHARGLDSDWVTEVANARRRTGRSEPWLTILPSDQHIELMARAGWPVDRAIDAARWESGAKPGRTLLVTAHPIRASRPSARQPSLNS